MRISTLVCTAVLSFVGLTASAQDAPLSWTAEDGTEHAALTSADQIDPEKIYTITCPRGSFYCKDSIESIVSNWNFDYQWKPSYTPLAEYAAGDKAFQFQFKKGEDGNFYWYCVANGKYVSMSPQGDYVDEQLTPVYFAETGDATYPLGMSFTDDRSNFNIQMGGSHQPIFDSWNQWDDGNKMAIVEAEPDPTTGINSVNDVKKSLNDGATYNLAGQRVESDYKGVVIRNRKKFVNR